jgi:hypothetical protein
VLNWFTVSNFHDRAFYIRMELHVYMQYLVHDEKYSWWQDYVIFTSQGLVICNFAQTLDIVSHKPLTSLNIQNRGSEQSNMIGVTARNQDPIRKLLLLQNETKYL